MIMFLLTLADEQYKTHIEQLYMRHHKRMLKLAARSFARAGRANSSMDAEDAVQSTFAKIVRYAHTIPFEKPEKELQAYVYTILKHEIIQVMVDAELTIEDADEYVDPDSAQEFGERLHIREHYREVVTAIRNMSPRYSTVLLMYYCENIPIKKIAAMLELPEKTVYTRLRRGKQQLIDMFAKEDGR